jgi:FkbM family methyltransferase
MYSANNLHAVLDGRLDAFARTGGVDWRVLEEPETRDVSLDGIPVLLLGIGSQVAQPFVERCLESTDVRALIDNGQRGTRRGSLLVKGDEAYAEAVATNPAGVDVICCGGVGGMLHFDGLVGRAGRKPLHLFQAMRRVGLAGAFPDDMWLEYADPVRHTRAMEQRDLGPVFADELSRRTYYSLLLYRLSWSPHWLRPVRQPCEDMYFKSDLVPLGPAEHLIDGGAYTGDSIADFAAATGNEFSRIDAFEPDRANFAALSAAQPPSGRIELHQAGLWSTTGRIGFSHEGRAGSAVSLDGDESIDVIALDDLDLRPTLIKLDVEGAELSVLEGARRTLMKCRPSLMISVYHRVSHLWDVVAFLETLDLGYRFGLRHYSAYLFDSILYAY